MTTITEADVEEATFARLAELDRRVEHGPEIAPDTPNAERADYGQVVLELRLPSATTKGWTTLGAGLHCSPRIHEQITFDSPAPRIATRGADVPVPVSHGAFPSDRQVVRRFVPAPA